MFKEDKTSIDEDLDGEHLQNEPKMSQRLESICLILLGLGVDVIHRGKTERSWGSRPPTQVFHF